MNKKLLIHVLENVRDNGEWVWTGDHLLYENERAKLRFEQSGYTTHQYIVAGILLVKSGKMLTSNEESRFLPPLCLTLDGFEYLFELKHPVLAWFKRNWFVATIATATLGLSAFSIGFNIWLQLNR